MQKQGWIKLHRKLELKGYYRKPRYLALWVHLLLKANHKETEFMWNGKIQKIKTGQLLTGRDMLSKEIGIPSTTIERILELFTKEGQIGQQKTTKWRLITVYNYKKYQLVDNKWTTNGQQTDTYKKREKEKNDKERNIYNQNFEKFWNYYPKKIGKYNSSIIWNRLKPTLDTQKIMLAQLEKQKGCKDWLMDEGKYIPHPSTYLNGRRWEDEIKIKKSKEEEIWKK